MDKDVKAYGKTKTKGSDNYRKFKQTGNERYMRKAKYNYNLAEGYQMKLSNPAAEVNIKQTTVSDSFKTTKNTTYGVSNPKTTFTSRKKVVKVKK